MVPSWILQYSARSTRMIFTAQAYRTTPDVAVGKVTYVPMPPATYPNPKWAWWCNTTTIYSMLQVVVSSTGQYTFTLKVPPPTATTGYLIILSNHPDTMDKVGSTCGGGSFVTTSV